jgi:hypothetical protein
VPSTLLSTVTMAQTVYTTQSATTTELTTAWAVSSISISGNANTSSSGSSSSSISSGFASYSSSSVSSSSSSPANYSLVSCQYSRVGESCTYQYFQKYITYFRMLTDQSSASTIPGPLINGFNGTAIGTWNFIAFNQTETNYFTLNLTDFSDIYSNGTMTTSNLALSIKFY